MCFMKYNHVPVNKMRIASQTFLLLAIASILARFVPAAAKQGIQIQKAVYGVVPHGPSRHATAAMRQQCNCKEGCCVYADQMYLWPDPAFRKLKSLVVTYSCNGKVETLSFPDTAQAVLKCSGGASGSSETGATPATAAAVKFNNQVFNNTAWRVQGDAKNLWLIRPNGTTPDEKGTWTGTWTREGSGMRLHMKFKAGYDQEYVIVFRKTAVPSRPIEA